MIEKVQHFNTLLFQEIEPHIGLITMNRPDHLNAINLEMLSEFHELFQALSDNDTIRVVIITGAGRGYSSGADLKDAVIHKDTVVFADPGMYLKSVQELYSALIIGMRKIPQPIISAVNGPAAGGGFCMTLASDIRVASPEAYFVASFINIGLSGGELASSFLLPRLVGLSWASDILYTGRKVMADEAEKIGLVSRVVPGQKLIEAALSYARVMVAKSLGGLKLTKRVLDENLFASSLQTAVNLENRNQTIMVFSGEFFKLIQSFHKG